MLQALLDWFERIAETERGFIELERAVKYDKLGVQNALLLLQTTRDVEAAGRTGAVSAAAQPRRERTKAICIWRASVLRFLPMTFGRRDSLPQGHYSNGCRCAFCGLCLLYFRCFWWRKAYWN